MELFTRTVDGKRIWYAWIHYFDNTKNERSKRKRSTGITNDGSRESKAAAEHIARDFERTFATEGERAAIPKKTLQQAIDKHLQLLETEGASDASIEIVNTKAPHLFDFFGPDTMLKDISEEKLLEYARVALADRAPATVQREMLILRLAFKCAKVKAPTFPKLPDPPPGRTRILELHEQLKLLKEIAPKRRLNLTAYLQLGVRKSELSKAGEVNWELQRIFINGTKTKKSRRWVHIPDELFEDMLIARDTNPKGWQGFEHWEMVDRDLRLACKRAEIEVCTCNDLRRTYATHMARSGCQSLQLAKYMGTSVRMLEEVYARVEADGEHHREAVNRGTPRLKPASNVIRLPLKKEA